MLPLHIYSKHVLHKVYPLPFPTLRHYAQLTPVNAYKVLGIKPGVSRDEIKKAFLQKAKQYHPDLNANDSNAQQRFVEVREAYELIKNTE